MRDLVTTTILIAGALGVVLTTAHFMQHRAAKQHASRDSYTPPPAPPPGQVLR